MIYAGLASTGSNLPGLHPVRPVRKPRHNVVFGVGPRNADVMFVGEGPGQQEDLQGEPFVGPAGRLLGRLLWLIDLGRHNCYIANIVKLPSSQKPGTLWKLSRMPASTTFETRWP